MYTHAHRALDRAKELERLFFGLSVAEQSFKACTEARQMCTLQREALTSQRERLGTQRRRLAERAEEAGQERRLL